MAIDPERLQHIPSEHHQEHSFCFWLHDLMVHIMKYAEAAKVATVKFQFETAADRDAFHKAENPILFFLDHGRVDIAKRIVINHIVIPLFGDTLHFLYEALTALEKHKFTVAFALLRKPLKYNLMLATWIFADEDDFFERMRKSPADYLDDRSLSKERRIALLEKALAGLPCAGLLSAQTLYDLIFDRSNAAGFAPYFDMAAHPVTSHPSIRTDELNLNLIFKNPSDNDVYEKIYYHLAYVLTYLVFLELGMIGTMASVRDSYRSWLLLTVMGCAEALFNIETNALEDVNKICEPFLTCIVCDGRMSIDKDNAVTFFLTEEITCPSCHSDQQLPWFWLRSQTRAK